MPTLNLQQLLSSDTIGDLVEKLNQNFSQLSTNGGGPQGSRGNQGPPGLPGLRGESGPSGDAGADAKQVTMVEDDPNWPTLYAGDITQTNSASSGAFATAAIAQGYNEGDIWIDNNAGVFYDIHEKTPGSGIYVFEAHPISASSLATGDYWRDDEFYSINDGASFDQQNTGVYNTSGIKLSHRYGVVSITSEVPDVADPAATAAAGGISDQGISVPYQSGFHTFGYTRPAYKLSIDNEAQIIGNNNRTESWKQSGKIDEMLVYGAENNKFSPLLYLNSTDNSEFSRGFGILHSKREQPSGDILDILSIGSSSYTGSSLLIDTTETAIASEYINFLPHTTTDFTKAITYSLTDRNGDGNTGLGSPQEANLWLTLSDLDDGAQPFGPSGRSNLVNRMGMRLRRENFGGAYGLVSFYIPSDMSNDKVITGDLGQGNGDHHIMSILNNNVLITNRDIGYSGNNNDILRKFKFAVESDATPEQQERIAIFKGGNDGLLDTGGKVEYLGIGIGDGDETVLNTAFGQSVLVGRGPAIIYSLANTGAAFPTNEWNSILLQPSNAYFDSVLTGEPQNTSDYGVAIGSRFASRFGVEGNFAIGTDGGSTVTNYQSVTAPDYGGIIQGNVVIGDTGEQEKVNAPYSFKQLTNGADKAKLTIRQNNKQFAFITTDHASGGTAAAYTMFFTMEENFASIKSNWPDRPLAFGVEKSDIDTIFDGNFLTVHNNSNVAIGRPSSLNLGPSGYNPLQRLVITKTSNTAVEGLQITNDIAGVLVNSGFQYRLNADNHGEIHQGIEDAQVRIKTKQSGAADTTERVRIMPDGSMRIRKNHDSNNAGNPSGNAVLDIRNGDNNIHSVSIGTMNNDVIDGIGHPGGGYVGYNAEYDEVAQEVNYHSRIGTTLADPGAAGAITFTDNLGGWHVAPFFESGDTGNLASTNGFIDAEYIDTYRQEDVEGGGRETILNPYIGREQQNLPEDVEQFEDQDRYAEPGDFDTGPPLYDPNQGANRNARDI